MRVTLITPTRDRPKAFARCEKWVGRQDFKGDIEWVVVDDGDEPVKPTMGQTYVRMAPTDRRNTLPSNLYAGLARAVYSDAVVIIEDDDWYAPQHVSLMVFALKSGRIAGDFQLRYYHVPERHYFDKRNGDGRTSSLAQTAFCSSMIPTVAQACQFANASDDYAVDRILWALVDDDDKAFTLPVTCVGIKGMGERPGLGRGHAITPAWKPDKKGVQLRAWIGADADEYIGT